MHAGVDIAANEGTPVRAAAAGVVKERSYDENGYGWLLKVDHGDGWETRWGGCTNSLLERLLERFIA
jgi:murein DD-endopeptidase MepM/ murein hydrolase activator NlpD